MLCGKTILGLVLVGAVPSLALAQTPTKLVQEGDAVVGVGAVTGIENIGINDSKMWVALVDTDLADSNQDGCVLRNGFVTLREFSALDGIGTFLDDFTNITLTSRGDLGLLLKVKNGSTAIDGAYWNLVPVAKKDSIIVAPPLGLDSDWEKMEVLKMNASNTMLVMGEIQNTAIGGASSKEDALIRYQLDNVGRVLSTTVLATRSMDVPVLGTTVNTLGSSGEHILALNARGDYFLYILGIGRNGLVINMDRLVAAEADASPIPGVTWKNLGLAKLALNDRGDFLYTGALNGDFNTYLIVTGNMDDIPNQRKFAQAGDFLPGFSTQPLANGSAAPMYIANNGDIFWRAEAQGTGEDAFMRNYTPIIQLNKTVVNGNLVTSVFTAENAFAISPNGRFLAGRVELQVIGEAALLVDFGLVLDIQGCNPNPGELRLQSGQATAGKQMVLAIDEGQVAGARPVMLFSTKRLVTSPAGCGAATPYGELLIGLPEKVATFFLPPWDGTNPVPLPLNIPNSASLVDAKFYAQGFFRDVAHATSEEIRLTNALQIEIGAP